MDYHSPGRLSLYSILTINSIKNVQTNVTKHFDCCEPDLANMRSLSHGNVIKSLHFIQKASSLNELGGFERNPRIRHLFANLP